MAKVFARVNEREIIGSGSIIFENNDDLHIYPFTDDSVYKFRVRVSIGDKYNKSLAVDQDIIDGELVILLTRQWVDGSMSAAYDIYVAEDNEYDYLMSIVIYFQGPEEDYGGSINYTISRVRLDAKK